jgi:hypothetical protein
MCSLVYQLVAPTRIQRLRIAKRKTRSDITLLWYKSTTSIIYLCTFLLLYVYDLLMVQ